MLNTGSQMQQIKKISVEDCANKANLSKWYQPSAKLLGFLFVPKKDWFKFPS